jgi:hypothetical protein
MPAEAPPNAILAEALPNIVAADGPPSSFFLRARSSTVNDAHAAAMTKRTVGAGT